MNTFGVFAVGFLLSWKGWLSAVSSVVLGHHRAFLCDNLVGFQQRPEKWLLYRFYTAAIFNINDSYIDIATAMSDIESFVQC